MIWIREHQFIVIILWNSEIRPIRVENLIWILENPKHMTIFIHSHGSSSLWLNDRVSLLQSSLIWSGRHFCQDNLRSLPMTYDISITPRLRNFTALSWQNVTRNDFTYHRFWLCQRVIDYNIPSIREFVSMMFHSGVYGRRRSSYFFFESYYFRSIFFESFRLLSEQNHSRRSLIFIVTSDQYSWLFIRTAPNTVRLISTDGSRTLVSGM